ncbi:hypothetical protein [Flavihumibacter sp. ZG627]|uniref:hypothetical protein n=1 Tax=Flavihumibacter sp. ZG627 TaxID=1463156 RepID=UPI00057D51BF|nr:hypothetical protein [Flavihumibacter sp. ZG627]KIC90816.1 hypothetical protein HY58_07115 [Flavihumibacter sp. ZG627]
MRLLLFGFLLLLTNPGFSREDYPVPVIIKKLAEVKGPVNTLGFSNDPFLLDLPYPFEKAGATLVKTNTELLALVNGTGWVYALDTASVENPWRRIDSTVFTGYNMGCLTFYADGQVWSYGGYGLWNNNGHLRYYAKDKYEWEIKPLNREIPHIFDNSDLFYLDTANARLYMLGIRFINDALKDNSIQEKEIGGKTWCLDIRKGNWEVMGETADTTLLVLGHSPWGMLTYRNGVPSIADFVNNQYLHANAEGIKKFSSFSRSTKTKSIAYFVDSTLYFGDHSNFMDSIGFSRADFVDSGVPIYSALSAGDSSRIWYWSLIPLMAGGILLYYRRRKRAVASPEAITVVSGPMVEPFEKSEPDPLAILDERDRSLLLSLYTASRTGGLRDIDTINAILGVSNKSLEIQKRQRSDALNAINKKMSRLLQTDKALVIRTRSEEDKRTYHYTVNPELKDELERIMVGIG